MQLLTNTFLALFPLYFYMATGAVLRKMKILKTEDLPKMNALLFRRLRRHVQRGEQGRGFFDAGQVQFSIGDEM